MAVRLELAFVQETKRKGDRHNDSVRRSSCIGPKLGTGTQTPSTSIPTSVGTETDGRRNGQIQNSSYFVCWLLLEMSSALIHYLIAFRKLNIKNTGITMQFETHNCIYPRIAIGTRPLSTRNPTSIGRQTVLTLLDHCLCR